MSCLIIAAVSFLIVLEGSFIHCFSATPEVAPIRWRVQCAFPGATYIMVEKLCKRVEERTGGRLILKPFPTGSIVKAPELLDAISKGLVEAGFSASLYYASKIPETFIEHGLPFTHATTDQVLENFYDYKNGMMYKLTQEAFMEKGVVYLTGGCTTAYGLFGNFPVNSIDDFKGKKIRATAVYGLLVKELGASTVMIEGAENYMAFQRGIMDATFYPYRTLEDYKLKEVVKYMMLPAAHPGNILSLMCNPKALSSLPDDVRKILVDTAADWARNDFTKGLAAIEQQHIKAAEDAGVKKMMLPDSVVEKLRSILEKKVWPVYAEKTERCKAMWDLTVSYLREKKVFK
jgi:TRAP-type mannitol/chloroaromatic compound transport system substrate-binding protein